MELLGAPPILSAPLIQQIIDSVLGLHRLAKLHTQIAAEPDRFIEDSVLRAMNITVELSSAGKIRVPASGPLVVVANHPLGLADSFSILSFIRRFRTDIRFMSTKMMESLTERPDDFIFVDNVSGNSDSPQNRRAFRQALQWLKREAGVLVVFPAGAVSRFNQESQQIEDLPWAENISRLIQISGSAVLPIYVDAKNSAPFYKLGAWRDQIHSLLLIREFFKRRNKGVRLVIGPNIPRALTQDMDPETLTEALRESTYKLANSNTDTSTGTMKAQMPIAKPFDPHLLEVEVNRIARLPERILYQTDDKTLQVILMKGRESHIIMESIGIEREKVFRSVGEGSGKSMDLDRYDDIYEHLILWDSIEKRIIGAYRLVKADTVSSRDLYSSQFFDYRDQHAEPVLELGRAFISPDRKGSLMLLWKGIGRYLVQNPRYRVLTGTVSISQDFSPYTQHLLIEFLRRNLQLSNHSQFGEPREAYRLPEAPFSPTLLDDPLSRATNLKTVEQIAEDLESDSPAPLPIPELFRHYADKLGGRVVAFTIDHGFNSVDAFFRIETSRSNTRILRMAMGDGYESYRDWTEDASLGSDTRFREIDLSDLP